MIKEQNKTLLVEIARNPDSSPNNRVDACKLIHKCGLLPASEVLSILQETVDDSRSKDNVVIKAISLMNEIDNSAKEHEELSPEQKEIVEETLLKEYLDVSKDST